MAITVNRGNDTDIFHYKLRPSVFMKLHSTVNDEPIKWYNEYICSKLHLFPATGENTSVISGQRERSKEAFFKTSFKLLSQTSFGFIRLIVIHANLCVFEWDEKKERRPLIIASLFGW